MHILRGWVPKTFQLSEKSRKIPGIVIVIFYNDLKYYLLYSNAHLKNGWSLCLKITFINKSCRARAPRVSSEGASKGALLTFGPSGKAAFISIDEAESSLESLGLINTESHQLGSKYRAIREEI